MSASDRIPDRFYVIRMEFLSLSRRRSSAQNIPIAAKSKEKPMFLQASLLFWGMNLLPTIQMSIKFCNFEQLYLH